MTTITHLRPSLPRWKLVNGKVYQLTLAQRWPGQPDSFVYRPARGSDKVVMAEVLRLSQERR